MKFAAFTQENGKEVLINLNNVSFIEKHSDKYVGINVGGLYFLVIAEYKDILKTLEKSKGKNNE